MEQEQKKCLLILPRIPYPPVGGDKLKNFFLIDILSRNFQLHIVIITDETMTSEAASFLSSKTVSYKHFRFPKYRFLLNLTASVWNNYPLQVNYYYFNTVHHYINQHFSNLDLVICNLIRTARYADAFPKEKKFLDIVDSISLNYERSLSTVTSLFWKIIYHMEVNRLLRYEERCVREFKMTFFVNADEASHWAKVGSTTWIPNGVANKVLDNYQPGKPSQNAVVFFGKMDYQPNVDAVVWFCNQVLPLLHKNIRFLIIGVSPSATVKKLTAQYPNVEVLGFLENPYKLMADCMAVVAPMQSGGGIQNKILESMGLGQLVITSTLGATPIKGAEDGQHLLVADDPKAMAALINTLQEAPTTFNQIKENARQLILTQYTWAQCEEKLMEILPLKLKG